MLNEVSQTKQIYDITYMWNLIKMIQMKLFRKQKQIHRTRNQTYGYQREIGGQGSDKFRSLGLTYTHYYV